VIGKFTGTRRMKSTRQGGTPILGMRGIRGKGRLSSKMKVVFLGAAVLAAYGRVSSTTARAEQVKRPFTVADEIGLTLFDDPDGGDPELRFSPNGNYFAVWSERGLVSANRVEDSLTFYRTADIRDFMRQAASPSPPRPLWTVKRTEKEGRVIGDDWRWLADSSAVAFVERASGRMSVLMLADVRKNTVESLTDPLVGIKSFDIRDRNHYVYSAADPAELQSLRKKEDADRAAPAIVGTGQQLTDLLFPEDSRGTQPRSYLWAVLGSSRFQVKNNGVPIAPDRELALSPDSQMVVTRTKVPMIPSSWERLYPPPYPTDHFRLQPGKTNVFQFVSIDLKSGSTESLTDAPISGDAGFWAWVYGSIQWSDDSRAVLLPGTYVKPNDDTPSRPCVAVVDLNSKVGSCVERLKGHTETGREENFHEIGDVQFEKGKSERVRLTWLGRDDQCAEIMEYEHKQDGAWQVAGSQKCLSQGEHDGLEVAVKQGLNEPPRLVATADQGARVIWNANPQLKDFDLGEASAYKWRDKEGHEWEDGLYKPPNYKPGTRYPLVIQTHGFSSTKFLPSGVFPTAYAARALAAQGIVVLQLGYHCPGSVNPDEGLCMASAFASATKQLAADGIVDPERVGIIGFSRSCYHVMEALTTNALPLKAASITDGVMEDYLQYLFWPDFIAPESDLMIGARPFGKGLALWLKRSPGFNLDKIKTPLLISAEGRVSMLSMWEPYAGLLLLHKPVDLILLNTEEHVLTNPAVRMASQGGSVEWFRFWLQGYEDPDPAKAEQYKRWRGMRELQAENEKKGEIPESVLH
jgi:hypothetical protein